MCQRTLRHRSRSEGVQSCSESHVDGQGGPTSGPAIYIVQGFPVCCTWTISKASKTCLSGQLHAAAGDASYMLCPTGRSPCDSTYQSFVDTPCHICSCDWHKGTSAKSSSVRVVNDRVLVSSQQDSETYKLSYLAFAER